MEYDPRYLQAFGLIEVEWNRVESELFLIFHTLSGASLDKSHEAFFAIQNHRGRRDMLEAIAVQALYRKSTKLAEFTRLMRRVKNAATKRNEIVHCLWQWNGDAYPIWPVGSPLHDIRDMLREFRARAVTIRAVRDDLSAFLSRISSRRKPLHSTSRWPVYRSRAS